MMVLQPEKIVVSRASEDAETILKEGHVPAFIARRFLRSLLEDDGTPSSPFFRHGAEYYERYVILLERELDERTEGAYTRWTGTPIPRWPVCI